MAKKEKLRKVCFWVPERWLKIFDKKAHYVAATRTEMLRNIVISTCIKGDPK